MSRPNTYIAILFALMISNFLFDWWRRYDFQTARASLVQTADDIRKSQEVADTTSHEVLIAVSNIDSRTRDLAEIVASLQAAVSKFLNTGISPQSAPKETLEGNTQLAGAEDHDSTHSARLSRILDTPSDAIREELRAARQDKELFQAWSKLMSEDPHKWPLDELIEQHASKYGITLTDEEMAALNAKLESYKALTLAAGARYQARLQASIVERLESADYESPSAANDGSYDQDPRISSDEDVFAISLVGSHRFRWDKSRHESEYQASQVGQYVPLVMLQDLDQTFKRRTGQ